MARIFRGMVLAIAVVLGIPGSGAILGCADPSAWELLGEVRLIELRETVGEGDLKKGSLDYSIRNTGRSTIEGCRFAFTFSTDKNDYHVTVVDENSIVGGALIYGQVSIPYASPGECGNLASAVVDSVQLY
jgi:hypothetical protein